MNAIRDFFRYWGLVLWTAFRHSSSLAQNVVFGLLIMVWLIAWFVPPVKAALTKAGIDVASGEVAAIVFGSIIAIRLLLAPYWLYQEQAASIARLKRQLQSRLTKRQIREQLAKFMDEGRVFLLAMVRRSDQETLEAIRSIVAELATGSIL